MPPPEHPAAPIGLRVGLRFLEQPAFEALCHRHAIDPANVNMLLAGDQLFIAYRGDLSDLGNALGAVIGGLLAADRIGYTPDDLFAGLHHGLALAWNTMP